MIENISGVWKKSAKRCLLSAGVIRILSSFRPSGVVILRYHSVLKNPSDLNDIIGLGIVHSAETFELQMKMLIDSFAPVTMDDVLDFTTRGKTMPRRAVAVTFDDGFADNAEVAAPIMERYGIRGAFYVTTGAIAPQPPPWFFSLRRAFHLTKKTEWKSPLNGVIFRLDVLEQRRQAFWQVSKHCAVLELNEQRNWLSRIEAQLDMNFQYDEPSIMMTVEQIRKLHAAGHIVGSHTVSHPNVAHIDEQQMKVELESSKHELEKILGISIAHFSYPSPILQPHFDERTIRISRDLGYSTAVTCTHGQVNSGDDPLVCRRITVPENVDELRWNIESIQAGFHL